MRKKIFILILLIVSAGFGMAQVLSDFEGGNTDGWVSEGDGNYYFESGFGNPGGCFRVDDDATGDMNYSYAPLKFLGDWSNATSSDSLSADIFLNQIATGYVSNNFVFRIKGPGGQATAILGPNPPFKTWKTYKVSLSPSDWQLNSGTWSGLMMQVSTLIVTMEYISGDEFNRLDNVKLTFTPTSVPVNPVICSTFEEGDFDGWTFTGHGGVANSASGGNPGKFIQINNGSGTTLAFAPTKFLGDWNNIDNHGADIRFDLKITSTSGSLVLNNAFLQISGPGGVARIPMDSSVQLAFGRWQGYSFPVVSSAWTVDTGTWSAIIDQVISLQVCLEFTSGSETVGLDNFCISNLPPDAGFTANTTYSFVGNPVTFADQSSQGPTSWNWNFGDGNTSSLKNPIHIYNTSGLYSVSLQVANHFGDDTELKTNYIQVLGIDSCLKFSDDFTATTIHPAWTLQNGTWTISNGTMRQSANYYGSTPLLAAWAITGSPEWTGYVVSTALMSADNDRIGLVFNFQDYQNMYMFVWYLEGGERALYKWVNGTGTVLASDNVGYATNTWYQVKVGGYGGNIRLEIDGQEIFNVWDSTFSGGKAGLYNWANQNSYYDNFVVECAIPDSLNPGNTTIPAGQSECYEALRIITIGGTEIFEIQAGGAANLVAGEKISMLPGVKVYLGGLMTARISTNGYYCNTPSQKVASEMPVISGKSYEKQSGTLQFFPNPTHGLVTMEIPVNAQGEMVFMEVYNTLGKQILDRKIKLSDRNIIDLTAYPAGLFLVIVRAGDGCFTGKVMKQ